MKAHGRLLLLAGIALLVVLFFVFGLHRQLSLEGIRAQQESLQALYRHNPVVTTAAFAAVYIAVVALNLPGAVVLGIAAGALFGTGVGVLVISFASSIGAVLACAMSRYLLRDWVQRRFFEKLKRVNAGIQQEGAFYLFALRLMPVIPFFIINLVMGLTSIRLWTFYWVSQVGMLPGTAVFVNAGSQIGRIDSLKGLLSPELMLSLALIGLFPLVVRKGLARFRLRRGEGESVEETVSAVSTPQGARLEALIETIRSGCTDCGACRKSCAFLSRYGSPGTIVSEYDLSLAAHQKLAYECSLCGLCAAVCPEHLDPAALFMETRRRHASNGHFQAAPYRGVLNYEKRGVSPLFSWYGLPEGCDTVFFPGCNLPGTRPEVTLRVFKDIKKRIPSLGIVLDCCAKPSHDLGLSGTFHRYFDEMKAYLKDHGVRTVLTACPNCTAVFRRYADGIDVRTLYEALYRDGFTVQTIDGTAPLSPVTVHDACALRNDPSTQKAVRGLLSGMGFQVQEMKHRQKRTVCCGEGGTVAAVNPELAKAWASTRKKEADGRRVVTYCGGCTDFLKPAVSCVHLIDLIYRPDASWHHLPKTARAPFTYWNRLKVKRWLSKNIQAATTRSRPAVLPVPTMDHDG